MDIDKVNKWLALATNVGVLAGLIFLGLEINLSNNIARSEQARSRTADMIAFNAEINEYADIWVKGSTGNELSAEEQVILDNLIENIYNQVTANTQAAERLGNITEVALQSFATILYLNPGIRNRWLQMQAQREKFQAAAGSNRVVSEYAEIIRNLLVTFDEQGL